MTQQPLPTAHPETLPEQYEIAAANVEKYLAGHPTGLDYTAEINLRCTVDSNALLAIAGYLRQIRDLLTIDDGTVTNRDIFQKVETLFEGSREEGVT